MLSKRIFVLVSLLLVSFLLVGCGLTTPPIVDNQAPGITSNPVTDAEVGILYTYDVEAEDLDGDVLTYSLIRNPSGMEIDKHTGVITWEDPTVGKNGVTVKVSDGVLSDTQSFTVTVEPVAKLTKIEVTPDTMNLEVEGTGTFTVTAYYSFGDSKEVTHDTNCVYTLTQPTAGVITVTAGSITAVGVGTDTIFISYTENGVTATANISVTVSGVRIPMTITVDLPTFTVGGPYWFTVNMIANDDSGKSVVASFDWPISDGVKIAGTLETDVGSDVTFALIGDVFQTEEFLMEDTITVNFRGTFDEVGTYETTLEVRTSLDGDLLCTKVIDIVVILAVGNSYEGGIVAYILQSDDTGYDAGIQHGLIAATVDQSEGIAWAIPEHETTEVTGALLTIGSGSANTDAIIAQHGGVSTDYAAGVARAYTDGIYTDWFLPSKDELNKLWLNRGLIGNFADDEYWSSSEYNANSAWDQNFNDGNQDGYFKFATYKVRAVRAF